MVRRMPGKSVSSRRAWRAAALSVSVFLLAQTVLGFAVAQDGRTDAEPDLPASFGTPVPQVGDRLTYELALVNKRTNEEVDSYQLFNMEWLWDDEILDSQGRPTRVHLLDLDGRDTHEGQRFFDPHGNREVAHRLNSTWNGESQSPFLSGGLLTEHESEHSEFNETRFPLHLQEEPPRPPCGLYHALQGTKHDTSQPIDLMRSCMLTAWITLLDPDEDNAFRAVRAQRLGDRDVVVYERVHDEDDPGNHNVTVYLADDVPYPLRIEVHEYGREDDWEEVVRLTHLDGGQRPLDFSLPGGVPAPDLVYAPTTPWGIDDSDVDHPFPLSMAYENALEDLLYDDLRDFLEGHPDAFTTSANYVEFVRDQEINRRWTITVADANSHVEFCSYQRVNWGVGYFVPGDLPVDLPEVLVTNEVEPCDWIGEPVDPAKKPERMPTARSLMEHAQAYLDAFGYETSVNSYHFRFDICHEDNLRASPGCMDAGVSRHVATSHPDDDVPHLSDDQAWHQALIHVNLEGFITDYREHLGSSQRRTAPTEPAEARDDGQGLEPSAFDASPVPSWQMPDAKTMVGVGLAAVLLGSLYYVWPLLKGGALGLFTRIRASKVLDHPTRRRIEEVLSAEPGLHLKEIARRLDVSRRTAAHHLRQLQQAGRVTSTTGDHYTCYFLPGTVDRRLMAAAPLLKAPGARDVLKAITEQPGRSLQAIATATGLKAPTVHHHAKRLAEVGLVEARCEGRTRLHYATGQARNLLGEG